MSTAGDTGWNGDIAGARNRYLRWDSTAIIEDIDHLEVPLFLAAGAGSSPPQSGYPPFGDQLASMPPIVADATVRRAQQFICMPGEAVLWQFGEQSGTVTAAEDGSVTVTALAVVHTPTVLVLQRSR